jgi:hypothetical protein
MAGFRPNGAERRIRRESLGLGNLSGKVEMDMLGDGQNIQPHCHRSRVGLMLGGFAFKATPL